jgi:hypothetical protein
MVVTTGNPVEGPARRLTAVVAKPGRAAAEDAAPNVKANAAAAIRMRFILISINLLLSPRS